MKYAFCLESEEAITQAMMAAPGDVNASIDLAKVDNDIIQLEFEIGEEVEIYLTEKEKGEFCSKTKTYTNCVNNLKTHQEKVFGLIMGQCTQLLQDKLKQDLQWSAVSKLYDPLQLYSLIQCVDLKQADDQYPFMAVVKQAIALLTKKQGNLSNAQWYERFNTKCELAKSVGMQFDSIKVLWEYCVGLLNNNAGTSFSSLTADDQSIAKANAEEHLLAYHFIQNSSAKMDSLK